VAPQYIYTQHIYGMCSCRFSYYAKVYDIQTLAMLSCVFQAYDNAMATAVSVVDDDGPNGFTIVIQQSKVCCVIVRLTEVP